MILGFPNRIDACTLSGGSWVAGLPLDNLKNRVIGKVARSTDDALASTKFDIDMSSAKIVNALAVINHNLSLAAQFRIRATNESTATNLLTYSEQFDNAAWTKTRSTVSANAETAPDGQATADKLVEDGTASNNHYAYTLATIAATTVYTWSIYAKAGERTWLGMSAYDGSTHLTYFNLSAGTVGTNASGNTASIESIGDGWYRCVITRTSGAGTTGAIECYLAEGDSDITFSGDGTSGLYLWGAQLEAGSTVTSYYPTTSSSATRPAGYMDSWQNYLYDSNWQDVWPSVYPYESLEWESDNYWSGQYTEEEISGYTTALVHILPSLKVARYWRIEFDDTSNSDGYVQCGRVFIGPTWEPEENVANGAAQLGWETKTDVQEALGGAEYFQRRTPFRVSRFTMDILSESEALANAFEIQRRAGVDQEVLWIHDSADTVHQLRRRFLGRLRQLSPIEYPYGNLNKTAWEVKELI
jgi:hypothetical protein